MNYKGKKDQVYICEGCNSDIPFQGYSRQHKFCSNKCQHSYRSKLNYEKQEKLWLEGKCKSRKLIYKFLVAHNGNKCSCCGITEWQGKPIRLWVDHIDGNATNNQPENFRLICPNCDSQSETFGAKNYGKGRKSQGLPQYG